ncbi:hypothetical protein D3C78_761360 [compost metagenome]
MDAVLCLKKRGRHPIQLNKNYCVCPRQSDRLAGSVNATNYNVELAGLEGFDNLRPIFLLCPAVNDRCSETLLCQQRFKIVADLVVCAENDTAVFVLDDI